MDLLVSDTSVLVDLERGDLVEAAFGLPYRFVVPDLLYERELKDYGGPAMIVLGLVVADLTSEQLVYAQTCIREAPALSVPDSFALSLAAEGGGTLLTGDRRLRDLASKKGVACHGLLWLLDEMWHLGIGVERLRMGLQRIQAHPQCRLPTREVNKRLAQYGGGR